MFLITLIHHFCAPVRVSRTGVLKLVRQTRTRASGA